MDKYTVLELIIGAHNAGYKQLRNDLIEDVRKELNDKELELVMGLVARDVLPNLQIRK